MLDSFFVERAILITDQCIAEITYMFIKELKSLFKSVKPAKRLLTN